MTPFTPGVLTAAQAAALNDLARRVAAVERMNATAPLTVQKLGGSYTFGMTPPPDGEFDAVIYEMPNPFNNSLYYSWRRVEWRNDGPVLNFTGYPSLVDPDNIPSPATPGTENYGYQNLIKIHRDTQTESGLFPGGTGVQTFFGPPPIPATLTVGRIVRIKKTSATVIRGTYPDTVELPVYATDGVDMRVYQFAFLASSGGALPANTKIVTVGIKADNLYMYGDTVVAAPIVPPPPPSPGPGHTP